MRQPDIKQDSNKEAPDQPWEPIPLELELPLPYKPKPKSQVSESGYKIIEIDLT